MTTNNVIEKIWWHRYINYERHFTYRTIIRSLPVADILCLNKAASHLPFPLLSPLGTVYDDWMPYETRAFVEQRLSPVISPLFNPWYLSPEGWEGFQHLWKMLPEPHTLEGFKCPSPKDDKIKLVTLYKGVSQLSLFCQAMRILDSAADWTPVTLISYKPVEKRTGIVDSPVEKQGLPCG